MANSFVFNKQEIIKFLSKVQESVMFKVNGVKPLEKGEWIGSVWRHFGIHHSGQLNNSKVLPNGNTKYRLITVLDNPEKTFALETKIVDKQGQVVSASSGIFHPKAYVAEVNSQRAKRGVAPLTSMGTESYVSTFANSIGDVQKHADRLYSMNPNAQRMFFGKFKI